MYLCSELISYHNFHHKYFCIKCLCCFELRKAQKHIYCQRRRQFNRFQNRACCVQWSEYRYFIIQLSIFKNLNFTDRMITALNYDVFLDYIILILIIHNNITDDKNVDLTRNMSKPNFNHDRRQWSIAFLKLNEHKQQILYIYSRHWRCMKIFSPLIYIKSMIHSF